MNQAFRTGIRFIGTFATIVCASAGALAQDAAQRGIDSHPQSGVSGWIGLLGLLGLAGLLAMRGRDPSSGRLNRQN